MADLNPLPLMKYALLTREEAQSQPTFFSKWADLSDWQKFHDLPLIVRRERYEAKAAKLGALVTGLHQHQDFCAVYLVRSGSATHRINNESFLMARGDVYLLAPGAVHSYEVNETLEVEAFYFLPEIFAEAQLDALRCSPGFWRLLPDLEPTTSRSESRWHLSPQQGARIEDWTQQIFRQWAEPDDLTPLVLSSLFFLMLARLSQWRERGDGVVSIGQSDGEQRLMAVLTYCESHLEQELSVGLLANRAFLSPGRFTRLFQQHTGISPAAFVRTLRIERAKTLLLTTELSVQEIARRCGFRDGAHLSRVFRAIIGQAPHQWRHQRR